MSTRHDGITMYSYLKLFENMLTNGQIHFFDADDIEEIIEEPKK